MVKQLEKEREGATRRAKKLQQQLKQAQQERATDRKKMVDYKLKLSETQEASRTEIAKLQAKLIEVTTLPTSVLINCVCKQIV